MRLETILCKFTVGKWMASIPGPLWELVSTSATGHHHASVVVAVSPPHQLALVFGTSSVQMPQHDSVNVHLVSRTQQLALVYLYPESSASFHLVSRTQQIALQSFSQLFQQIGFKHWDVAGSQLYGSLYLLLAGGALRAVPSKLTRAPKPSGMK